MTLLIYTTLFYIFMFYIQIRIKIKQLKKYWSTFLISNLKYVLSTFE